jgi:branched-chain amino acid transport system substrate-binding protein
MRRLADADASFSPERCPVVSCDLAECELGEIAEGAAIGQLATASYFDSLATSDNLAFKRRIAARFGGDRRVSSYFAGAYTAVRLCAETILAAGDDEPSSVRDRLHAGPSETVLGPLAIDPRTNHAALPFHLGRINAEGGFDILASKPAIAADPYLVGDRTRRVAPHLRLVR